VSQPLEREVESAEELRELLVGRRIVGAEREPDSGKRYELYENTVTLTLDDGATVRFAGWGYDASCCETTYTPGP
jgi:hypothetical protein